MVHFEHANATFDRGDNEAGDRATVNVVTNMTTLFAFLEYSLKRIDPVAEQPGSSLLEALVLSGHLLGQIIQGAAMFTHDGRDTFTEGVQQPGYISYRILHIRERLDPYRMDQGPDLLFHDGVAQFCLAAEMMIEGALGQPGPSQHLIDPHTLETMGMDLLKGGL